MKWGRKKSWNFSSPAPVSTLVSPVSWLSKFKPRKIFSNQETSDCSNYSAKRNQRDKLDFHTPDSSLPSCNWKQGRFYSMDDDDAFWRLSFSDERIEGRRSTGGINPLWYDSDEEFKIPISRFKSFGLKDMEFPIMEETRNFNDMVSDIKKMKEKQNKDEVLRRSNHRKQRGNVEAEMISRWKKDATEEKCRRRAIREKQEEMEKGAYAIEPENIVRRKADFWRSPVSIEHQNISFPSFDLSPIEEDYVFAAAKGESSSATTDRPSISEWRKSYENNLLQELKVKTEECHGRRTKQNHNGIKAPSQRTECKVRDMKKARMKLKKKKRKEEREEMKGGKTVFDSFAVVKTSFNPQQDFRDSMIEMIRQKRIRRSNELEELLACYLTLNRDEYHDLIVKVFRQVWFELNGVCDDPEIRGGQSSCDDSEIV